MMAATNSARRQPAASANPFGDFLREVQSQYGCKTVADLVRLIGVDQSSVSRYLSGQSEPTPANLRKIAAKLGVTLGYLMVHAGIATREDLGMVEGSPVPLRTAPVLLAAQAFLDDPTSSRPEKDFLIRSVRALLNITLEAHEGAPHEPSHAERQRRR
ncbi:MAG TPA: helix-turn-helix transcriptional regulator [Gemmatimonadales bacterium]